MLSKPAATVVVDMDEPYVQDILLSAFAKYSPLIATRTKDICSNSSNIDNTTTVTPLLMHWREYERIDWDAVHRSNTVFSSTYCYRKGLIRKAQMALNIKMYMAKHPESILTTGVPETWIFELDDIDYLEEALMECFEVEDGMRANAGIVDPRKRQQFILKPSLTGRGAGIYVFDTRERLEELLEIEFGDDDDNEEKENEDETALAVPGSYNEYQAVSQIREWVIQRYINQPLLLSERNHRKFHIRTYVLAAGNLNVYVYRQMLALFAPHSYTQSAGKLDDQKAHLTNTCLQTKYEGFVESEAVDLFWNLEVSKGQLDHIFDQICRITGDTFAAVSSESTTFQTWSNCLEQFGFDFMVDENYQVYLLEANSYPDFKQTGKDLKSVVEGFFAASVATAVCQLMFKDIDDCIPEKMQETIDTDCKDLVQVFTRKHQRKW